MTINKGQKKNLYCALKIMYCAKCVVLLIKIATDINEIIIQQFK